MPLPIEETPEVIVGSCSILADRCPQPVGAFVFFQSSTCFVDDIIVERDVVGKDEILAMVFRIVIRHHIGEVGKMLGGGDTIRVALRSRSAAKRCFRLSWWIAPRLSRLNHTIPPCKAQEKAQNKKVSVHVHIIKIFCCCQNLLQS